MLATLLAIPHAADGASPARRFRRLPEALRASDWPGVVDTGHRSGDDSGHVEHRDVVVVDRAGRRFVEALAAVGPAAASPSTPAKRAPRRRRTTSRESADGVATSHRHAAAPTRTRGLRPRSSRWIRRSRSIRASRSTRARRRDCHVRGRRLHRLNPAVLLRVVIDPWLMRGDRRDRVFGKGLNGRPSAAWAVRVRVVPYVSFWRRRVSAEDSGIFLVALLVGVLVVGTAFLVAARCPPVRCRARRGGLRRRSTAGVEHS